jgi:hypothetical protein
MHSQISPGKGAPVLFIGGVHGDEPEGVALAQHFLEWLRQNPNTPIYNWALIPCLNVDGFARKERTNGRGVDLNRNFPTADWSPETKAPRYNPGSQPGSELEVQAVVSWIQQNSPRLIVHFHSWEPCVVYSGVLGKGPAHLIGDGTGFPVREDIGYPTPGSLGQYGLLNVNIPVVCVESPEKISGVEVWKLFGQGLQKLIGTPWSN